MVKRKNDEAFEKKLPVARFGKYFPNHQNWKESMDRWRGLLDPSAWAKICLKGSHLRRETWILTDSL
jgi:hypothetical protein